MRKDLLRTALCGLLLTVSVAAQANDPNCHNALTQAEMNICAARDFEAADRELNAIYRQVRRKLNNQDATLPADLRGIERQLIEGQRGWIAYRDGHCAVVGAQARGGSMESGLISSCAAGLTRHRTAELQGILLQP